MATVNQYEISKKMRGAAKNFCFILCWFDVQSSSCWSLTFSFLNQIQITCTSAFLCLALCLSGVKEFLQYRFHFCTFHNIFQMCLFTELNSVIVSYTNGRKSTVTWASFGSTKNTCLAKETIEWTFFHNSLPKFFDLETPVCFSIVSHFELLHRNLLGLRLRLDSREMKAAHNYCCCFNYSTSLLWNIFAWPAIIIIITTTATIK